MITNTTIMNSNSLSRCRPMRWLRDSSLIVLFALAASGSAQVFLEDTFICSPTAFDFTLNFTATCADKTIVEGSPGIQGVECLNLPNDPSLIPVSVRSIQVIELDINSGNLDVTNFVGSFSDGATVEYSSVSSMGITDLAGVPGGLQLNINGVTQDGENIVNSFIIEYTNEGTISPIFKVGDQIGWIVISDLAPARPEYCPAVTLPPSTMSPATSAPVTGAPVTGAPVTGAPVTGAPVLSPTIAPIGMTTAPVAPISPTSPTSAPAAPVAPSGASIAPTEPIALPTDAPAVAPVESTSPVATIEPSTAPIVPTDQVTPATGAPSVTPVGGTDSPVAPVEPSTAPNVPSSPVAPPTDAPNVSPMVPTVPVSPAPIIIETPFPTDFSMSFYFERAKTIKKKRSKGSRKSKDFEDDGDDDDEESGGKGETSGKIGKSSKDETHGAKSKGDDDDDDGYNIRAAGRQKGEKAEIDSYFGRRRRLNHNQ